MGPFKVRPANGGTPVISLHRNDPKQVGDQASTPASYSTQLGLPWLRLAERVDIEAPDLLEHDFAESIVIIGGGGLTFDNFQANIRRVIAKRPRALIWWGGGHNVHLDPNPYKSHGRYEHLTPQELMYPDYLRTPSFDAIGVRDPESTQAEPRFGRKLLPYVPCPSVMLPAFHKAQHVAPRYEAVIYIQKDPLMPELPAMPTMSNATRAAYNSAGDGSSAVRQVAPAGSPGRAIRFISHGELVITNSYHGALWGQQLGKPVVVVDGWSTKFHRLPVQEAICAVGFDELQNDLRGVLERATTLRDAHRSQLGGLLADSRRRNIEFGKQVERVFQEKGVVPR
jgi:hypothetical protein